MIFVLPSYNDRGSFITEAYTLLGRPPREQEVIDKIERQDAEIGRQRREIERLEAERAQLERARAQWERDRARWERERIRYLSELHRSRQQIDRLEVLLTATQRAGFRQAAPFSKGAPSPAPKRPDRKSSPAYGRAARRIAVKLCA